MFRKRRIGGFRRKRGFRRNKGAWFPIIGSTWIDEAGGDVFDDVSFTGNLQVGLNRGFRPTVAATGIVRDQTPDNKPSTLSILELPSLRDYVEGQEYILRSIVGNISVFCKYTGPGTETFDPNNSWKYVKVAAGFFVGRASEDEQQAFPDYTFDEIDPQRSINSQNPWIWRRTWILANPANLQTVGPGNTAEDEISSNRSLSDLTGPFIQTKAARRVRREQRLWFVISAIGWNGVQDDVGGTLQIQPEVDYNLDARVFGKLVKGKNASVF